MPDRNQGNSLYSELQRLENSGLMGLHSAGDELTITIVFSDAGGTAYTSAVRTTDAWMRPHSQETLMLALAAYYTVLGLELVSVQASTESSAVRMADRPRVRPLRLIQGGLSEDVDIRL